MTTIFFIVIGIALFWWVLWIILAISKKDAGLTIFLLVTGVIWAVAEIFLALAPSYAVFGLLIIPIVVLAPMLRIVTEYERGVLFRLGRQKLILGPGLQPRLPAGDRPRAQDRPAHLHDRRAASRKLSPRTTSRPRSTPWSTSTSSIPPSRS